RVVRECERARLLRRLVCGAARAGVCDRDDDRATAVRGAADACAWRLRGPACRARPLYEGERARRLGAAGGVRSGARGARRHRDRDAAAPTRIDGGTRGVAAGDTCGARERQRRADGASRVRGKRGRRSAAPLLPDQGFQRRDGYAVVGGRERAVEGAATSVSPRVGRRARAGGLVRDAPSRYGSSTRAYLCGAVRSAVAGTVLV